MVDAAGMSAKKSLVFLSSTFSSNEACFGGSRISILYKGIVTGSSGQRSVGLTSVLADKQNQTDRLIRDQSSQATTLHLNQGPSFVE